MKLLTLISTLLLLTNAQSLFSQKQLVLLNDSSYIIGNISKQSENELKIVTKYSYQTINKNNILNIYELYTNKENSNSNDITFFNISDIGMLAGKREGNEKYSFSFNMVNGAEYKEKLSIGLGFGIEFMDINIIPVFTDVRYTINEGYLQCFAGLQAGFAFPLEESYNTMGWDDYVYQKGLFYNPMLGVKANFNNSKNAFIMTLGFRHMNIIGERWDDWWVETKYEREFIYDRFSFRVGYVFM
jgi:hypothetical protein